MDFGQSNRLFVHQSVASIYSNTLLAQLHSSTCLIDRGVYLLCRIDFPSVGCCCNEDCWCPNVCLSVLRITTELLHATFKWY